MKILNVVDGPGWTGGVEQALILSRELRRRGVDARLAAHVKNPVLVESASAGVPAYPYQTGSGKIDDLVRLGKILRGGYEIALGHKPGAIRDLIPLVCSLFRRTQLLGVRRVSYSVPRFTTYLFPVRVVAVADSVRETLVKSGLKAGKVTVIPSGVDLERFRPDPEVREFVREQCDLKGKKVILNLAKFVPEQKGQRYLFSAVTDLRERYPLKLLLAGLNTDGKLARLLVREYGLEALVELLGFRRDIPELLNAADLFVFPSLPGLDAIAGSVLQAMACGKVVISSAVGGIPEYLKDGENGFLVPPGDDRALQRTIEKALEMTESERVKMGLRARKTVQDSYSAAAMAESYLRLFSEMGVQGGVP